jgi:hypothetical protein
VGAYGGKSTGQAFLRPDAERSYGWVDDDGSDLDVDVDGGFYRVRACRVCLLDQSFVSFFLSRDFHAQSLLFPNSSVVISLIPTLREVRCIFSIHSTFVVINLFPSTLYLV